MPSRPRRSHQAVAAFADAGILQTLNSTQRRGGFRALYRGFGVSAVAIGSYKALYFGLYDTACAALEHVSGWTVPPGWDAGIA
jgi:hypothetical protein